LVESGYSGSGGLGYSGSVGYSGSGYSIGISPGYSEGSSGTSLYFTINPCASDSKLSIAPMKKINANKRIKEQK
jgi:hypothetical protein